VKLPLDEAQAEPFLPEQKADGSGVEINYADALLKPVKLIASSKFTAPFPAGWEGMRRVLPRRSRRP
jgi:hypothetical protein